MTLHVFWLNFRTQIMLIHIFNWMHGVFYPFHYILLKVNKAQYPKKSFMAIVLLVSVPCPTMTLCLPSPGHAHSVISQTCDIKTIFIYSEKLSVIKQLQRSQQNGHVVYMGLISSNGLCEQKQLIFLYLQFKMEIDIMRNMFRILITTTQHLLHLNKDTSYGEYHIF